MSIKTQTGSRKVTMTTLHLVAAFVFACLFLTMSYLTLGRGSAALDLNILIVGELAIAGNLGIFTSGNVKVHATGSEAKPITA